FVPAAPPAVRWDAGVAAGSTVPAFYDPLLAKVIAHAPTRAEAAAVLAHALEQTLVDGVRTNRDLLVAILRDEAFLAGATTTDFLDARFPDDVARTFVPDADRVTRAAIAATAAGIAHRAADRDVATIPAGFSNGSLDEAVVDYTVAGGTVELRYARRRDGRYRMRLGADEHEVAIISRDGTRVTVEIDGHRFAATLSASGDERHVLLPDGQVSLVEQPRFPRTVAAAVPGASTAPMPGSVVAVHVTPGQTVAAGDPLVTVEAMKLQHPVTAGHPGTVASVRVALGDQVDAGAVLVVVDPAPQPPPRCRG
ncbi:MAG: biotin/lipoyl-binding protein, partial [Actinomycetota bacterium]|nr:biotin/lipoyl-binding protein [Actinomycetota bacterium]